LKTRVGTFWSSSLVDDEAVVEAIAVEVLPFVVVTAGLLGEMEGTSYHKGH